MGLSKFMGSAFMREVQYVRYVPLWRVPLFFNFFAVLLSVVRFLMAFIKNDMALFRWPDVVLLTQRWWVVLLLCVVPMVQVVTGITTVVTKRVTKTASEVEQSGIYNMMTTWVITQIGRDAVKTGTIDICLGLYTCFVILWLVLQNQ